MAGADTVTEAAFIWNNVTFKMAMPHVTSVAMPNEKDSYAMATTINLIIAITKPQHKLLFHASSKLACICFTIRMVYVGPFHSLIQTVFH